MSKIASDSKPLAEVRKENKEKRTTKELKLDNRKTKSLAVTGEKPDSQESHLNITENGNSKQ